MASDFKIGTTSGGVTMHQAQSMIAQNNEELLRRLNRALGGG